MALGGPAGFGPDNASENNEMKFSWTMLAAAALLTGGAAKATLAGFGETTASLQGTNPNLLALAGGGGQGGLKMDIGIWVEPTPDVVADPVPEVSTMTSGALLLAPFAVALARGRRSRGA